MKSKLLFVFAIIILASLAYATELTDNTQAEFDLGTYTNTEYNSSDFVQLSGTNTTGIYTSQVFYAGSLANWENISWESFRLSLLAS